MAMTLRSKLLELGCPWSREVLDLVCLNLQTEGIFEARALIGAEMADVAGCDRWPPEVRDLLGRLARVRKYALDSATRVYICDYGRRNAAMIGR